MAGYIIADVEITHPTEYEEYRKMVMPTLEEYGGKFLVRGGASETLEGDWAPGRLVILEFASVARAKEWWGSEQYRPARRMRQAASRTRMIVVEGA